MEELPWGVAVHRPQFTVRTSHRQGELVRSANFVLSRSARRGLSFFHYIGN